MTIKEEKKRCVKLAAEALDILPESAGYEALEELADVVIRKPARDASEALVYASSIALGYDAMYT